MALVNLLLTLLVADFAVGTPRRGKQSSSGPVTCPGFPGYCSESYPGQTCLVVCARGRNNVPECQADGTWTDVPRCIEHEPGIEDQVPGICPGIPGYCSLDSPGGLCTFQCSVGPPIRSTCTSDGTWEPYPTCQGDPRETQDGCNPCPGPLGGPRNRTAETSGGRRNSLSGGDNSRQNSGHSNAVRTNGGGINNKNKKNNRNKNAGNRSNNRGAANRNKNSGNRNKNKNGGNRRGNRNNQRPSPAQQPRSGGGFKSKPLSGAGATTRRVGGGGGGGNTLSCPGSVLQACIDVCPGFSPRVFSACVSGCAKRCPGKK